MASTTFRTASGNSVELSIVTSRQLEADATLTAPDWRLDLRVNGESKLNGGVDLVEIAGHGKCLKPWFGNWAVPVPAEAVDAVESVLNAYRAGVRRDVQAIVAADQAESAERRYPHDTAKAVEWDRGLNEGGDGYNPYR